MRLIDADALKERLKVSPIFPDFGQDGFFIRDMVIDLVDNQRTVDAVHRETLAQVMWERDVAMKQLEEHGIPFGCKADVQAVVHGEWLDNGDRDSNGVPKPFAISCSACGSSAGTDWMKYCPNCGAKMDRTVSE